MQFPEVWQGPTCGGLFTLNPTAIHGPGPQPSLHNICPHLLTGLPAPISHAAPVFLYVVSRASFQNGDVIVSLQGLPTVPRINELDKVPSD